MNIIKPSDKVLRVLQAHLPVQTPEPAQPFDPHFLVMQALMRTMHGAPGQAQGSIPGANDLTPMVDQIAGLVTR